VRLKEGLLDPQGKAIEESLPHLGWTNVSDVRVGKHIELDIEAADEEAAHAQLGDIAHKLLANPVIEEVELSSTSTEIPLGGGSTWKVTAGSSGQPHS
jgi:phosphoribosylformylglycinamidine synthase